jgi:hypothetical protein
MKITSLEGTYQVILASDSSRFARLTAEIRIDQYGGVSTWFVVNGRGTKHETQSSTAAVRLYDEVTA